MSEALNLGRRFVELTLPQAKEYNPYRVEMAPSHTLPRREGLFVPFCVLVSRSPGGAGRVQATGDVEGWGGLSEMEVFR